MELQIKGFDPFIPSGQQRARPGLKPGWQADARTPQKSSKTLFAPFHEKTKRPVPPLLQGFDALAEFFFVLTTPERLHHGEGVRREMLSIINENRLNADPFALARLVFRPLDAINLCLHAFTVSLADHAPFLLAIARHA